MSLNGAVPCYRHSKKFLRGRRVQHNAVFSLNEPYTFTYVSEIFSSLLNFDRAELLGQSVTILQGPSSDASIFIDAIKNAQQLQRCAFALTAYRRDGSMCDLAVSCSAHVTDGVVDGVSLNLLSVGYFNALSPQSPQAFGSEAVKHRASGRAEYNRIIGTELGMLKTGQTSRQEDLDLLEALISGLTACDASGSVSVI